MFNGINVFNLWFFSLKLGFVIFLNFKNILVFFLGLKLLGKFLVNLLFKKYLVNL